MEASALSAPAGLSRETSTSPWLRLRSDEQLVGLFRSGNEEAFRVIHDRYRQRLYGYARQMLAGSGPDAEDVMQDVFLRAYRALRVDERPVSLRAWLYRVAHNRCIDSLRRPVPVPSEVFEMSRSPVHDPFVEAERREDLQRLVADVRRLPDQQRSALLMREMDGMSYADLATALETSVPAVKSLLVRARIGLVEAIEARDTDCADIRHDLAASYDRGVRTSGRARRHLRDCDGCTTYRAQLRGVRHGFAALSPATAGTGLLAKLLGIGGASGGGAAAAGGAASGTGVAIGGGAAAAVSVSKVAAVVCCAAAITGGAVEVKRIVAPSAAPPSGRSAERATASAAASPAHAGAAATAAAAGPAAEHRVDTHAEDLALHPPMAMSPSLAPEKTNANGYGGHLAPADEAVTDAPPITAQPAPATAEDGVLPVVDEVLALPGEDEASTTGDDTTAGSGTSSTSGTQGSGPSTGTTSGSSPGTSGSGSSTSSADGASTTAPASGSSTSGSSSSTGGAPAGSSGPSGTASRS